MNRSPRQDRKPYAHNTRTPVTNSQAEIRKMVLAAGGTALAQLEDTEHIGVQFTIGNRSVRFVLDLHEADPREVRRRWRCLALQVKSAIILWRDAEMDLDRAFFGHLVLSTGETLADAIEPELKQGRLVSPSIVKQLAAGPRR